MKHVAIKRRLAGRLKWISELAQSLFESRPQFLQRHFLLLLKINDCLLHLNNFCFINFQTFQFFFSLCNKLTQHLTTDDHNSSLVTYPEIAMTFILNTDNHKIFEHLIVLNPHSGNSLPSPLKCCMIQMPCIENNIDKIFHSRCSISL